MPRLRVPRAKPETRLDTAKPAFAVGAEPLLVHNIGFCDLLRAAKGDWDKFPALVAAAKRGEQIHPHHIVPKQIWKGTRAAAAPFIKKAQAILEEYGIDVLYSEHNLTWAINTDHSIEYAKAVATTLEAAAARGGKPAVLEALEDIAEILNRGEKFRGLQ